MPLREGPEIHGVLDLWKLGFPARRKRAVRRSREARGHPGDPRPGQGEPRRGRRPTSGGSASGRSGARAPTSSVSAGC
ncbi:MAG: hypothetical protein M0C28_20650 [Candidatus Moduliflexus flocculans]|nr:hypothetical protein [Candidatus Moduliflexus flocculans]